MWNFLFLQFFIFTIFVDGGNPKKSICPEEKKRHPGDCRLFYRCVPVKSAQTSVWLPTRCTAGKVFHPILKRCLPEKLLNNCDRPYRYEILERIPEEKDQGSNPSTSIFKKHLLYLPDLAINEIKKGPMSSAYNTNTSPQRIKTQMDQIYDMINNYKIKSQDSSKIDKTSVIGVPFFLEITGGMSTGVKPIENETPYPFKHQINTQSTSTPTNPNEHHQTNLNLSANKLNEFPFNASLDANERPKDYPTAEYLISQLFQKHMTNKDFIRPTTLPPKILPIILRESEKPISPLSSQHKQSNNRFCEKNLKLESNDDCLKLYFCHSKESYFNLNCFSINALNEENGQCNFRLYQNCGRREYGDNFVLPFSCEFTKRIPDPTSKYHYFICDLQGKSWKRHRLRCRKGLVFNKDTKTCKPS